MNKSLRYIILFIVGITCSQHIYSQAIREDFDDSRILANQDTVIISNHVGKWWFGPIIGLNGNIFYNTLTILKFPGISENPFNTKLNFTSGQDLGWFTGAFIEYMPPGEKLSYGARIYFPDTRNSSSETTQRKDTFEYSFKYSGTYKYVTLAPFVKYNFPLEGLYATLGLNLDYAYANQARLIHIRMDSSFITHDIKLDHEKMKLRYGLEAGAGWEFTVNDINDKVRVRFNPYITASVGSKILADLNSNWNNIVIKLGFAVKFGLNETTIDTIKYKIDSEVKPELYALLTTPQKVSFDITGLSESLPAYELEIVRTETVVQVALEGSMSRINSGTAINPLSGLTTPPTNVLGETNRIEPIEDNKRSDDFTKLEFGEKNAKKLIYSGEKDIKLTDEMKKYLDNIIMAYSKGKAIREIYIFGYTEELGSRQKNLEVSQQRAEEAYKYLISAGVGKKAQIYRDGKGALVPKKETEKKADKKINNRIEIIIK